MSVGRPAFPVTRRLLVALASAVGILLATPTLALDSLKILVPAAPAAGGIRLDARCRLRSRAAASCPR